MMPLIRNILFTLQSHVGIRKCLRTSLDVASISLSIAMAASACDPRNFNDPDQAEGYSVPSDVLRDKKNMFRNWLGEASISIDPSGTRTDLTRDLMGRVTTQAMTYPSNAGNYALDTSIEKVEYGWTTCSKCMFARTTLKQASGTSVQESAASFDAWKLEKTLNQTPKVFQGAIWDDVIPTGTGTEGTQIDWGFEEGTSDTLWRGPRMEQMYLHGSPRGPGSFADEEIWYSDSKGSFGLGPIDIDGTIGRASRVTNQKLGNCIGAGDCYKQIIEKNGYFGIWPLPGSGESLGQAPASGLMSPKYGPQGLGMMLEPIPADAIGPGLDAWANPNRSFTPRDCAGVTTNCCNTCPVEQDTVHKDTRPEQWCACNIEDIDHGEPNHDKKKEIECSGIASTVTGMGSGNALVSTTIKETWQYDEPGRRNWAVHKYNKFNNAGVPQWDQRGFYERTMTFNQADQPTSEMITRSEFVGGVWQAAATAESYSIKYDKRGNLWSDGRKVYLYDAYNRLTQVREFVGLSGNVPLLTGDPVAAFTYDGYGHRLTARYNANDNGTLDDDSVDVYSYDHLWRIRTVTQATHHAEGNSWTSFVREQWFYHTGEDPYGYKIGSDAPVMRRIDPDGDGVFDKTQNFVTDRQGSVVGVLGAAVPVDVNNEAAGMKPGEVIARVRYDTYGVP